VTGNSFVQKEQVSKTPNNNSKTPITFYKGKQIKTSSSSANLTNAKKYSTTQKLSGISKLNGSFVQRQPKSNNGLLQTQRMNPKTQNCYNKSS
jgi:hypothetical protein